MPIVCWYEKVAQAAIAIIKPKAAAGVITKKHVMGHAIHHTHRHHHHAAAWYSVKKPAIYVLTCAVVAGSPLAIKLSRGMGGYGEIGYEYGEGGNSYNNSDNGNYADNFDNQNRPSNGITNTPGNEITNMPVLDRPSKPIQPMPTQPIGVPVQQPKFNPMDIPSGFPIGPIADITNSPVPVSVPEPGSIAIFIIGIIATLTLKKRNS